MEYQEEWTVCGPPVFKYAQDCWEPALREAGEGTLADSLYLLGTRAGREPAQREVQEFKS